MEKNVVHKRNEGRPFSPSGTVPGPKVRRCCAAGRFGNGVPIPELKRRLTVFRCSVVVPEGLSVARYKRQGTEALAACKRRRGLTERSPQSDVERRDLGQARRFARQDRPHAGAELLRIRKGRESPLDEPL